jgi:xanthine/uracil/vitamin C permease (AzgA family)
MAENLRQPPATETKRVPRLERRGVLLGIGGLVLLVILGLLGVGAVPLVLVAVAIVAILLKIGLDAGRSRIDPNVPKQPEEPVEPDEPDRT